MSFEKRIKLYNKILAVFLIIFVGSNTISSFSIDEYCSIETKEQDSKDDIIDINNGLIGYWSFNEENGIAAYDYSINSNNGLIYGAQYVQGIFKTALEFDGVDDYVFIKDDDSLDFGLNDFSISLWLKTNSTTFSVPIEKDRAHTGNPAWFVYMLESGIIRFYIGDSISDTFLRSYHSINDNKWHHICLIRNATDNVIRIHIDGLIDNFDDGRPGSVSNNVNMYFGATSYEDNNTIKDYYRGLIDEIRFYNRALNDSEIKNLYSFTIGDLNGDLHLNSADIRYLAMYLNGDPAYSKLYAEGDVNSDGKTNSADVRYVAMYLVGNPEYMPLYP